MGMSDDLEVAVAEGSTMVRIGRGLFGPRAGIRRHGKLGCTSHQEETHGFHVAQGDALPRARSRRRVRRLRADYDEPARPADASRPRPCRAATRPRTRPCASSSTSPSVALVGSVRTIRTQPVRARSHRPTAADPLGPAPHRVVRPLQPVPSAKPHVVAPTSFNQAQEVADKFKGSHAGDHQPAERRP